MALPGCYGARNLTAVRASRLAADGTRECPNIDGSAYTKGSAIRFNAAVEVDAGSTDVLRDGDGNVCNTRTSADVVTSVSLDLELCVFDFELIETLTGGVLATSAGTTYGWEYPSSGETPPLTEFHGWARAWSGGGQVASPYSYLHVAFFKTTWRMGDFTLEENALTVPLSGSGEENPSISIGSFDDIPPEFIGSFGAAWFDTDVPDPNVSPYNGNGLSCGYIDTPACSSS